MPQEILDRIFEMLHIDKVGKKIDYVHNMIRERWEVAVYKPENYEECHKYLSRYLQYHYAAALDVDILMPEDLAYSEVRRILDGGQGGFVLNIKNALRGRQGGLPALVDLIAEHYKKDFTERYVSYIIGTHVNPMDFDLRVELMRQYLDRYGRYILPGEEMLSPYELAINYEKVITYHVQMINQYRNVLQ